MLPGLIAARVLLSKLGPGPVRQVPTRRLLGVRNGLSNSQHVGGSSSNRRISATTAIRLKRNMTPISTTTTSSDESISDRLSDIDEKISKIDRKKLSTIDQKSNLVVDPADIDWTPIYRFNRIRTAGLISRLKIVQTIFVVVLVPTMIYCSEQDQVSIDTMQTSIFAATFAMIMLYAMSAVLRRCIGVISISSDRQRIRIGYLTFWGNRRNLEIPLEDLVPLQEGNRSLDSKKKLPPYVHVKRYSNEKFYLYLPLWQVSLVDRQLFEMAFGEIVGVKKNK